MENQKEIRDLEAREPSEFLGQEGPILADGNKTRPRSKGNGKTKGFASGNRSIFSPGPRASGSENLEDEIKGINSSSCASEDSNSPSILEVLAGERPILNGTEMVEILGPMAEPLTKRPFPPVDRKSNKSTEIKNMDIGVTELVDDQEKIMGSREIQPILETAGRTGGVGKLDGHSDQNPESAKTGIVIRLASEGNSVEVGRSGEAIAGKIGGERKLEEIPDQNHGSARPAIPTRLASEENSAAVGRSGNELMRNGAAIVNDLGAERVKVCEGLGLNPNHTPGQPGWGTESKMTEHSSTDLYHPENKDWVEKSEDKIKDCERVIRAIDELEAKDLKRGNEKMKECERGPRATDEDEPGWDLRPGDGKPWEATERKKLGKDLGLRAKGGDLAFEGSTEEGEEITGTKGGPTALHGGWKRIAGDWTVNGRSEECELLQRRGVNVVIESLSEEFIGKALTDGTGGSRPKGGKHDLLDEVRMREGCEPTEVGGERWRLREGTGNKGIDRNMGSINGRIEVIPEGIAASTLGTESELKEESNPVPRGLRVVRLDVKDNGCPGISPDVRLGAGTGGNSMGVFRMEVNLESHLTTFYTQTGCGERGRKAGAHNDEHHNVKEGVMD